MKIDYDQVYKDVNNLTSNFIDKLNYYLVQYLDKNKGLYSKPEINFIEESLNALCLKHTYFAYASSSLWALSEHKRDHISYPESTPIEVSQLSQSEALFYCTTFELAIYEARSLIEFTMNFCSAIMRYQPLIIGLSEFNKKWNNNIEPPFTEKAQVLWSYFNDEVFGKGKWGNELRSIRDKIAHKTTIKLNREGREHILNVRLDWPTIKENTCDRFVQESVVNHIHYMTMDVFELLLGIKWQPGMLSAISNSPK